MAYTGYSTRLLDYVYGEQYHNGEAKLESFNSSVQGVKICLN